MPNEAPEGEQAPKIDLSLGRAQELIAMLGEHDEPQTKAQWGWRKFSIIRKCDTPNSLRPIVKKALEIAFQDINCPNSTNSWSQPAREAFNRVAYLDDSTLTSLIANVTSSQQALPKNSAPFGGVRKAQLIHFRDEEWFKYRTEDTDELKTALSAAAVKQSAWETADYELDAAIVTLHKSQPKNQQ